MRQSGPKACPSPSVHAPVGVIPAVHVAIDQTPIVGWLLFGNGSVLAVRRNIIVGRSPRQLSGEADPVDRVVVLDPSVSRRHLVLDISSRPPVFRDEGSRNGSWIVVRSVVRGPLAPATPADPGVEIVFGESSVRWIGRVGSGDPLARHLRPQTGRANARTFVPMTQSTIEELGDR